MMLASKYPPADRGTIIVWGLLASYPFGGMTWQVLHHLAGIRRLGFDVWYVEDSDRYVYDPVTYERTAECSANVDYLARYMEAIGLEGRWVFRPPENENTVFGALDLAGLGCLYRKADAAINICGAQELRPQHQAIKCLVYLETDPVKNQVAVAKGNRRKITELDSYDYLFTYGTNFGRADCLVPIKRYQWLPTRPPVCLDWWAPNGAHGPGTDLTTIANWTHSGEKDVVWMGNVWRWTKDQQFRRFKSLPARSRIPLELALGLISDEEAAEMRDLGWRIVSSSDVTEPGAYRDYIRSSIGEFTASKEQVVVTRCGWFSDRSACYLAAGRPVITQDTAFGNDLPTGNGLFAFATEDEAVEAIDAVAADYPRQSAAASAIAHEFFSAEHVLGEVLRRIGLM